MNRSQLIPALLTVQLLATALPNFAQASGMLCAQAHHAGFKRVVGQQKVDWKDDRSIIQALQRSESLGLVKTFFSKVWDTQVYFTGTGLPDAQGRIPLVDPDARAVYIFAHGSGTMKSGGKNFVANMNTLAKLGFASISIDMPFHSNGSRNPKMNDANYFMENLKSIVMEAKKSGKPIYLAGHSFGPDVILEFAARYPKLVDGIVALSPASFNKTLDSWYQNYTTKMKFGGAVAENEAGGTWAGTMSPQFLWSKKKLADPTVVNPNLKVRILSGNREEYVPAPIDKETFLPIGENTYDISVPLKEVLKNATVTIEPGIGHYLFEHVDAKGNNVVLRELLAVAGVEMSQVKQLTDQVSRDNQTVHTSGQLEKKYVQDELFKAWADSTYGQGKVLRIARQAQDSLSQKILNEYLVAQQARYMEIYMKIMATKETHPEFYAKYKVESYSPKKLEMSLFTPYLMNVLNKGE